LKVWEENTIDQENIFKPPALGQFLSAADNRNSLGICAPNAQGIISAVHETASEIDLTEFLECCLVGLVWACWL
jgi:hypothetical protein